MTENEIKRKLGIEEWSQMNLEKFRLYLIMSEKIDKETHLKIIEQVPNYLAFASKAINELNEIAKQNSKIHKSTLKSLDQIINSLSKLLEKDTISIDERKLVIDKILDVSKLIDKIDERHSNIIKRIIDWIGGIAVVALAVVAIIFGVKSNNINES